MAVIHVVIPCYNVEEYLEHAVESVLNQPSKDIDIVLVDDGSPDNSPRICDELARKEDRIHVIHQENGGLCAARNAGIEYVLQNLYTEGEREFVAFLDADDAWCPNVMDDVLIRHLVTDWYEDIIGFSGICSNFSKLSSEKQCKNPCILPFSPAKAQSKIHLYQFQRIFG